MKSISINAAQADSSGLMLTLAIALANGAAASAPTKRPDALSTTRAINALAATRTRELDARDLRIQYLDELE